MRLTVKAKKTYHKKLCFNDSSFSARNLCHHFFFCTSPPFRQKDTVKVEFWQGVRGGVGPGFASFSIHVNMSGMAINVEITKSGNDNNLGIIRKFTKRVQGSGILARLRGRRYSQRKLSEYVTKKKTLKKLSERARIRDLIKMGKMAGTLE